MVHRDNIKVSIHEILPHTSIRTDPIIQELLTRTPGIAKKLISIVEVRVQRRQRYCNYLLPDYYEFKFSAERDKIRIILPIKQNELERIMVDELAALGKEVSDVEVFICFKSNPECINGTTNESENTTSTLFNHPPNIIPYSYSQMNYKSPSTREVLLNEVPETLDLEKDLDSPKKESPEKSFYFEKDKKDKKGDTVSYDNTIALEISEGKKNLCNTNNIEASETNYVGLVNQAMTCYLNSLLQALFMTPEFRNAMYIWEYKNNAQDSETNSIPYQLQKLFLNLQTSRKTAVETTALTRSFGWDVSDSWHQHDIQELCRVMFDALEQKFKNTAQADLINRLYEGKINDYVKCLTCNTEKSREDTFLDIPLPVRPFDNNVAYSSVEEALEAFVKYETLEGSNQYFCEKCNKKSDAHKGLKFTKFPYILTLQLKRFDFDQNTFNRIKLNDRVTFPEILNLNSFIEPTANQESSSHKEENVENKKSDENSATDVKNVDKTDISNDIPTSSCGHLNNHEQDNNEGITMENGSSIFCSTHNENVEKLRKDYAAAKGPYIYELFSIMIHSGSANGGHYYAYIQDFKTDKWYCFNDQTVAPITKEEIQKTYGGGTRAAFYNGVYRSSTNAYMLMYRQIDPERNILPMEAKDFPPHIKKLLEKMKGEDDQNYHDEKMHNTERRFKQTIYCRQSIGGDVEKTDITMSMSFTLNEVVEVARQKFLLDYKFDNSQCRIVTYFPEYDLVDTTFDGKEEYRLDHFYSSHHMIKPLLLDVRPPNEEFHDYPSEPIITKVYIIDAIDKDLVYCPKYIRAYRKQTVREYKQELAKHFSIDLKALQLYSQEILPNELLEDDFVFDSLGSTRAYRISATDSYNEDLTKNFLESTFYKMHERLSDVITFYVDRKDVTKEQLDNLSIPSLAEHYRDVKNQENISNHYDYHSKDLADLNTNANNTNHHKNLLDEKSTREVNAKTDASINLNGRLKEDAGNNDSNEKRDCIDEMCPKFRRALNEIEINQPNKEKCIQDESKKSKNTGTNTRLLHDSASKEKNEEWNAQETSNSEDSSLSDSDRTLVGDAPEEYEFDYDNYGQCPIPMNTANEDRNYEKFFKIETLRMQNFLKISMDIQTTEEELKKKLESYLDIPKDYFKIVDHHASHLDELSSMTYRPTSDRLLFREDKKYSIKLERLLSPDEDQITLYILEMDSRDILGKLFTMIVKKNASIGSIKNQIIQELKRKPNHELSSLSNTPYKRWRFMEIENDSVGKVLDDSDNDQMLPESMREICIQQIPRSRETSTRIYTMKWNASKTVMLSYPGELEIDKNGEFCEQIKKKISETSNIPEENLEFCPLVATKDIDPNKIESADWKSEIRAEELDFKTHLLYRDSTDKSILSADASADNPFKLSKTSLFRSGRQKARGMESVPVISSPRKEKALKIRVAST